jgi:hypothetical protein
MKNGDFGLKFSISFCGMEPIRDTNGEVSYSAKAIVTQAYFDKVQCANIQAPQEVQELLQMLKDPKSIPLIERPLVLWGPSIKERVPTGFVFEDRKKSWFRRFVSKLT